MGFEKLMYAYYDQPDLIHRIHQDLLDFHIRTLRKMTKACVPTFVTFAEDMSYNHGPMISGAVFHEFLAPYYRQLPPAAGRAEHHSHRRHRRRRDADGPGCRKLALSESCRWNVRPRWTATGCGDHSPRCG